MSARIQSPFSPEELAAFAPEGFHGIGQGTDHNGLPAARLRILKQRKVAVLAAALKRLEERLVDIVLHEDKSAMQQRIAAETRRALEELASGQSR